MFKFVFKRILMVIPTFIAITFITFALVRFIPGDPVEIMMGERGLTAEVHQQMLHQLGLDLPLYQQYFHYIGNVIQGDFGASFRTQQPVLSEFFTLFPATAELAFFALFWSLLGGVILGTIAAVKKRQLDFSHGYSSIAHRLFYANFLVGFNFNFICFATTWFTARRTFR